MVHHEGEGENDRRPLERYAQRLGYDPRGNQVRRSQNARNAKGGEQDEGAEGEQRGGWTREQQEESLGTP